MTWPEAVFYSVCAVCVAVTFAPLVWGICGLTFEKTPSPRILSQPRSAPRSPAPVWQVGPEPTATYPYPGDIKPKIVKEGDTGS